MNCNKVNRLIKALQITLAVLLLVCACLLISACKHEHNYQSQVTVQPTCTSVGEMTYTCSECGKSYTEEISVISHDLSYVCLGFEHWQACKNCTYSTAKTAHNYNNVLSAVPATCYSTGIEIKACVCGDTTNETLPMTEHSFTVAQNDTANHWLKCANCSQTSNVEPHKFTTTVSSTNSTCQTNGSVVTKCDCGATHTDTLPVLEHSYTIAAYDDESHWSACSMCNQVEPINGKTLHNTSVVTTDPDCEKAGKIVTTCSGCEYAKTVAIPALGHQFDKTVFSKSSTGSGHYYKCTVCKNDIAEPHTLEDCDCPDGDNRAATCYKAGHQDQICSVCEWRNHFTTPMTDDHNWSSEWTTNGVFHWHACVNGNGACTAKSDETQHIFTEVVVEPTCTVDGSSKRQCECGVVQSGSNKVLKATGHDYEDVRVITPAECEKDGEKEQRCKTCGAESIAVIKALGHDNTAYDMERTNENGHYFKCALCGKPSDKAQSNHTWDEIVLSRPTCTQSGETDRTCKYCQYHYVQVTTQNHAYVTNPESYIDATCTEYGSHTETCAYCGDFRTVTDERLGYADHTITYYPKKDMTETQDGNRNYWQCSVCNKYFSSKDCHEELTEDEVFIRAPKTVEISKIDDLAVIADKMESEAVSNDYYKMTVFVYSVNSRTITVIDDDSDWELDVEIPDNVTIDSFHEGDTVTLKGRLFVYKLDGEMILYLQDVEIISIEGAVGEYNLFVEANLDYSEGYVYIEYGDDYYEINTKYYNVIMPEVEDQLTLTFTKYNSNLHLVRVIVNGEAKTVQNGVLTITVSGDTNIVLQFSTKSPIASVTLNQIDTSNSNEHVVDAYISYKYQGGTNDYGRLYQNSKLTFKVNNANIVGINITYEADWLSNNPEVVNNKIVAVTGGGGEITIPQGEANSRNKVVLSFDVSNGYVSLEYFANTKQARITEITVLYQSNNTFAY